MKTNNKITAIITAVLLAASAKAENTEQKPEPTQLHGQVEVLAGDKSTSIDTQLSITKLPVFPNAGLFLRNNATASYDGKSPNMTLVEPSYALVGDLGVKYTHMFLPDGSVDKRAGLEYFMKKGDFTAYISPTVGWIADDISLQTVLRYTPKLTDKVKLFTELESFVNADKKGYTWSSIRPRLGIEKNSWQIGAGAIIDDSKGQKKPDYNIGAFVRKTF